MTENLEKEESNDKNVKKEKKNIKPLEPLDPTPFYVVPLKLLQEKYFEMMEEEKSKVFWTQKDEKSQKEIESGSPRMLVQELTSEVNYGIKIFKKRSTLFKSFHGNI
jgi:hypothetical protein